MDSVHVGCSCCQHVDTVLQVWVGFLVRPAACHEFGFDGYSANSWIIAATITVRTKLEPFWVRYECIIYKRREMIW